MDVPGEEKHMDIPEWLYDKIEGQGTWYDMEYGKGFSPNYQNEVLIQYHAKAVKALGEQYGGDDFISYIELGSLGHWGEWHVNYYAGIKRLPQKEVREQYVLPWKEAFPKAMILMRRPFSTALKNGFGVYNDMLGEKESTEEWLSWIENGGTYNQTGEKNELVAMPDYWKYSPSGGEFTSAESMDTILSEELSQTIELIKKSHTTFLGPKIADVSFEESYQQALKNMGYRLWISRVRMKGNILELTWENSGVAPFYKDWEVMSYIIDENEQIIAEIPVELSLSKLLPDESITSKTMIYVDQINKWKKNKWKIAVGIVDPMTGKPSVHLAIKGMEAHLIVPVLDATNN